MGKSSGPAGNTTVTQTNPLQQTQQPYYEGLWGRAANQASAQYLTPDQTAGNYPIEQLQNNALINAKSTAGLGYNQMPFAMQGLQNIMTGGLPAGQMMSALMNMGPQAIQSAQDYARRAADIAGSLPGMASNFTGAMSNLAGQLPGYATSALDQLGGIGRSALIAANPAISNLMGLSGMAVSGNPAYDYLTGAARGDFLDPSRNPALAGTISAATDPIVRQFQTATAPGIDSRMEASGRYGSGVQANAQSVAQRNLGDTLSNTTSGIVNNAYNTGLQAMLSAGSNIGQLFNQGTNIAGNLAQAAGQLGLSGLNTGAGIINQGYSDLNSLFSNAGNLWNAAGTLGVNAGNVATGGLNQAGQMITGAYNSAGQGYSNAGTLAGQSTADLLSAYGMAPGFANYPQTQLTAATNAPWLPGQLFSQILGSPQSGSGTTTQPYYSNPTANALGTIGGITGIGSNLFGSAGLFPGALSGIGAALGAI